MGTVVILWCSPDLREDGQPEKCLDHFKKNLFKISDDPVRFCYAYISFLVEVKAPIQELNAAYATIKKVSKLHVSTFFLHTHNRRPLFTEVCWPYLVT